MHDAGVNLDRFWQTSVINRRITATATRGREREREILPVGHPVVSLELLVGLDYEDDDVVVILNPKTFPYPSNRSHSLDLISL